VANQFRQIKRTLLANALGKGGPAVANGRLLMMTSALPGEGKTFSTLNLALSLARERDVTILVVDADVAKPQVSGLFNMDRAPGLLEALTDTSVDIESLILRTDIPGLYFLPAGRCEGDVATELLASERMLDTVLRLESRQSNRVILFDSPPLLLTNEARVLASIVGQIVLVVRAGFTPQRAVMEAIGYVRDDKPIGLLLNQSKASAPGSYYGYGAYGYGEYGKDSARGK
jgi:exopolysaccharide/PEP-CTERM locus tyrosine autokinase